MKHIIKSNQMTSHQIADREEARAKIATSTHACCSARKLRWLIIAAFGQCVCEFPSCSMRHDLRNTLFLGQALILNTYEAGCVTYFSMKQWVSCFVQLKFRPAFLNSQYLNCCRVLYHTFIPHWTSLDDSGCRMFSCFRVIFFFRFRCFVQGRVRTVLARAMCNRILCT